MTLLFTSAIVTVFHHIEICALMCIASFILDEVPTTEQK